MATIIQFPNSISFLENLKAVRIASSETVAFKLSSGGSTILEETYSPGPSGIVEVELRDVISEYLAIAYPSSDVFNQASAIAQMTVNVDDGADQDFTVLSGGVRGLSTTDESFLRANWLTWQPQTKTVRWNQPEYLTFAHLSAGTVKAKFYTKAGGSETVTLHSASAGQVNTYRMQMSTLFAASSYEPEGLYGLVDVWVENGGVQQSYVQRYVCTPETRDEHYFSCVNSLGGIDTFCFTGPQTLAPSVEHAAALRGDRKIDITPGPGRSWTQGTGDLDRAESRWIWDFFNSSRHWAAIDGELEEIVIESSSVRASDAENLNAFDFAFSPVNTGRTMKIDRTSGQLPAMQVPSPTGDLFFLAPRIVDYPDATINGSLLLLTQSPLVQEWQKIGIGPLCDYLSDQIHNTSWGQLAHTHSNKTVIDALSEQDGKLLFNGQPVTPDIPQMPDHYIAGTKAKSSASDDALSRVTKISFTAVEVASESVDLEVVTIEGRRYLHTSLPFVTDSEINAGGIGTGGPGGGGLIETVYGYGDFGGTFYDADLNNTFNAYAINKLYLDIEEIKTRPEGGVTSISVNGGSQMTGAVALTIPSAQDLDNVGKAVTSLQSQIDSVASRSAFDELSASVLTADIILARSGLFSSLSVGDIDITSSAAVWNAKQDAIADLASIRSNASAAAFHIADDQNPHETTWAKVHATSGDNHILTDYIADGAITTGKIFDSAVSTAKIADGAITTAKIAAAAVTVEKLESALQFLQYFHYSNGMLVLGDEDTVISFATYGDLAAGGIGSGSGGASGVDTVIFGTKEYQAEDGNTYITIPTSGADSVKIPLGITSLENRVTTLESSTPNVSWGTAGPDRIPLSVNGVTKSLLTGHQSLANYYTKAESEYALGLFVAQIQSLQSQIDSVAARSNIDELTVTSLFGDMIAANHFAGDLLGNALTASNAASADSAKDYNTATGTINDALTLVNASLCSLQSQVDSVASRSAFDELAASALTADTVTAATIYGNLVGDADTLDGCHASYFINTANIGLQSVAYASDANTVDGEHASAFAHVGAHNNLLASSDEFTFASSGFSGPIYLNYRTAGGSLNGNISDYYWCDGRGSILWRMSTVASQASNGNTAYNDLTTVSQAIQSLQAQIDSVASRDFAELVETLRSLKMWIEDMFERTDEGIHAKHNLFVSGELSSAIS